MPGRVPLTNSTPAKLSESLVSADPPPKIRGLLPSVCRYTWYISSWSGVSSSEAAEEMGLLVRVTFKM